MPTTYQTAPAWQPYQEGGHPLAEFLNTLEYIFEVAIAIPGFAVPPQFRRDVTQAWEGEVKPALNTLRNEILRCEHNEGFERIGLSGLQLTLKLAIYGDAYRRTIALLDIVAQDHAATQDMSAQEQASAFAGVATFFRSGARKMLKYLFKPANVILGSMAAVAPLAHVIEEFKGMVETGLNALEFQATGALTE
jgi:hypothetical protein